MKERVNECTVCHKGFEILTDCVMYNCITLVCFDGLDNSFLKLVIFHVQLEHSLRIEL